MARSDCAELLSATGLPVVYHKWPDGARPEFPCIRYVSEGSRDFLADDSNYFKVDRWSATLVSEWKDDVSEELVESALGAAGVVYAKSADYYSDESRLNHVEYSFELPR